MKVIMMKRYPVFDNEMTMRYIVLHKYVTYAMVAIGLTLFVLSFWIAEFLYLSFIVLATALLLLLVFLKNLKKYGNCVVLQNDCLEIYDSHGRFLYALAITDLAKTVRVVLFAGPRAGTVKKECLILYRKQLDTDIYDEMEYSSYAANRSILFIENPALIAELDRIVN